MLQPSSCASPSVPGCARVLEEHVIDLECVQLASLEPVERLIDPCDQHSWLRLVVGRDVLARSTAFRLAGHPQEATRGSARVPSSPDSRMRKTRCSAGSRGSVRAVPDIPARSSLMFPTVPQARS